jgi:replicative DNA helicase/5S rRNA maturation endonuclease (ribonuclease M5)
VISFERVVDAFRAEGLIVQDLGHGKAAAQAPGHSQADRSVSFRHNGVDRTVIYCHSDPTEQVLDALRLTQSDLFDSPKGSTHTYPDGRIVRRSTDKKFSQYGNTKGDQLYRADQLRSASTVWFCEGESDVHILESEGVVATTTAGGAGNVHLFDLTPLHGKTVIVVRDMDEPGAKRARKLMELLGAVTNIRVVEPIAGKDATDHIVAGHSIAEFHETHDFDHAKLAAILRHLAAEADNDHNVTGIAGRARKALDIVSAPSIRETALKKFGDGLDDWWEWVDAPAEQVRSMPTPWPEIDDALAGGLQPGRSYLIAARPGHGKSIGLTNFALYASGQGYRGALFSIEMGRMEVMSRILAAGARAEYGQITRRSLDDFNRARIAAYASDAAEMPLWISDQPSITVDKIRADAIAMKRSGGLDFIAVDYLQLMKPASAKSNRQEQISEISWALKTMSRELDVAVLTACQLNRGNAKDKRPPALSDLRESGSLEQDADVVILLHHPSVDDRQITGEVEMRIEKNRTGPLHVATLPWRGYQARIGG